MFSSKSININMINMNTKSMMGDISLMAGCTRRRTQYIAQHSSCKRDRRVFCFTTYNIHIYICIFCFCSTIHSAQEERRKQGFVSLCTIFLLRVNYPTGLSFPVFCSISFGVCPISWFLMGGGGRVEVPGGKSRVLISHQNMLQVGPWRHFR